MRSLLLLLALALPATAQAGLFKKRKPMQSSVEPADQADTPAEREAPAGPPVEGGHGASEAPAGAETQARAPEEGSLWNYIEEVEGAVPDEDAVHDSEELDAERSAERDFLIETLRRQASDESFVADPNDPLHLKAIDPSEFDLPIVVNASVVKWMKYFTGDGRKYYGRWLGRSSRVRPMMYEALDAGKLPRDLVYLSMIESGYSNHAYSRAAAVGLWQFMSATGSEWGMRIDWWVDERRDPQRSTKAAVAFLGYLNKKFDSWYLAAAAYNGGPGRVDKGIKRHGTRDFWTLVERGAFHPETANYVPKLLAATIIGHHPERYGFTDIAYQMPVETEVVEVSPGYSMELISRCAGASQDEMMDLNPHIRRWTLPADGKKVRLNVPKGHKESFLAAIAVAEPDVKALATMEHRVRRGESLGTIATKYNVSVKELMAANRIRNANKIAVGQVLSIPGKGRLPSERPDRDPDAMAATVKAPSLKKSSASTSAKPSHAAESSAHEDRREVALASVGPVSSSKPKAKTTSHVVQRGENLARIADRYNVSQSDLLRWNDIDNANKILVGQRLKIVEPSGSSVKWVRYTVKRGDTLSEVASRYGVSASDIKSWNNLKGSQINVGQSLKIRKSG